MKTNYFLLTLIIVNAFVSCKKDENAPTITLLGNNPDTVIVKTAADYSDPGATASDTEDGNITSKIVIAPQPHDLNNTGSFIIYYSVEDNAHNQATKLTRTVNIVAATGTYDVSSTCPGNLTSSATINSYSNNDSISIQDFFTTGTVINAGLNNYKYEIATNASGITGTISATRTTLNGMFTINSNNCSAIFVRH